MEHETNKENTKYIKRRSDIQKINKIKNELFSLAQNEINNILKTYKV